MVEHNCEDEQWDISWVGTKPIYKCGVCDKEMKIEKPKDNVA